MGVVVYLTAVVDEAVRDDEVVYLEYHVVAAYLVEYLLGNIHCRGLVLNDDARAERTVVDHRVAPAAHAVELELHLVGHERLGVTLLADEVMYEMLAYPLFGRQSHILAAYDV